ncbi:alpha/beta-hydrolase, partial [Ascoidea rubescens DSM 1968]
DEDNIVPNITDYNTILTLAFMSSNAYYETPKNNKDWYNLSSPWNNNGNFDLNKSTDGVRGQIFVDNYNETMVIAIKGSEAGSTSTNDKLNDNLLFSCCCARISYLWTTVCDCYKSSYNCNEKCLELELYRNDRYYKQTLRFFLDIIKMYPGIENIFVTGHSLGGSLSSLLGRTFGLPVVTFEAVPELLATKRLHLPMPPGLLKDYENIYHFGNNADPIYLGTCNGVSSSCSIAGYGFETQCFSGKTCVYDVVRDKGWTVNILKHSIKFMIEQVIGGYQQ